MMKYFIFQTLHYAICTLIRYIHNLFLNKFIPSKDSNWFCSVSSESFSVFLETIRWRVLVYIYSECLDDQPIVVDFYRFLCALQNILNI